jgi:hypothetical protein
VIFDEVIDSQFLILSDSQNFTKERRKTKKFNELFFDFLCKLNDSGSDQGAQIVYKIPFQTKVTESWGKGE